MTEPDRPAASAGGRPSRLVPVASLVTALAVSALAPAGAQATQQRAGPTETYRLQGPSVAVHNLAGRVELVHGDGDAVRVDVTFRGADSARLSVATGVLDGRQTLRVLYPEDRVVYPDREDRGLPDFLGWLGLDVETELEVREDGRIGNGGRRVWVTSSGDGLRAWADLRLHVPAGQRLAVHAGVGRVRLGNVDGETTVQLRSGPVDAEGVRGPLTVDTGSGSVRVASAADDLEIDTGSGGVRLEGVTASRVRVGTGSGSVEGRGLKTESLCVDTGSGGIELREVAARKLVLDTGSGSVDVELVSDLDRGEIDTGSGGVDVLVPAEFAARLELDTGSAGIDVELPARDVRYEGDRYSGVVGDGQGTLVVDTGSGRIGIGRN